VRPEQVRKLVGGYAAGILTEEERRALFEAALSDQELFDELAREQPLRELLSDPRARMQLLNAVAGERPLVQKITGWLGRPASWVMAGGLAAVVLLVLAFVRTGHPPPAPQPVLTARREAPAPPIPPQTKDLSKAEAPREAPVPSAAAPMAMADLRADSIAPPATVPYRILRADMEGKYLEVEPQTIFRAEDRLRIAFDPVEDGLLRVMSGGGAGSKVLIEVRVEQGVTANLDLPAGESKLVVAFSRQSRPQPIVFEIQIGYQSLP
jgi:hypothetical protein